jgi:hypothetical protein
LLVTLLHFFHYLQWTVLFAKDLIDFVVERISQFGFANGFAIDQVSTAVLSGLAPLLDFHAVVGSPRAFNMKSNLTPG